MGREDAVDHLLVARDFLSTIKEEDDQKNCHLYNSDCSPATYIGAPFFLKRMQAAAAEMKHNKLAWITDVPEEQSPTNLPGSRALLLPGLIHPMQMQDSPILSMKHNSGSTKTQADSHVWSQTGDNLCEKYIGTATHAANPGRGGPSTKATSIFASKLKSVVVCKGSNYTATSDQSTSRTPVPASGATNYMAQCRGPLTIFYGGNVDVFDNISAVKVQEIMLLASRRPGDIISPPNYPILPPNLGAFEESRSTNYFGAFNYHDLNSQLASNMQVLKHGTHQVNHFMQFDIKNIVTVANRNSSPILFSAADQPLQVPTTLPHARKASLARFLEKRRERVQSKCPYALEGEELPED